MNVRRLRLGATAAAISCWLATPFAHAEPPSRATPPAKAAEAAQQAKPAPATLAPPSAKRPSAAARACFQKAQSAYVVGDLPRALAGFLCAYDAAPSAELHYNLARVYERMGEAEESIARYQAYLDGAQVGPKERKEIEARIQALRELRERQRAPLDGPKPTAEVLGAEARVFYDRGVKLYKAQQYQAALAAFSAALQMSNAPELHYNLGVVSERLQRSREAVDHYRAYLAARPNAGDRIRIEARIAILQTQPL